MGVNNLTQSRSILAQFGSNLVVQCGSILGQFGSILVQFCSNLVVQCGSK